MRMLRELVEQVRDDNTKTIDKNSIFVIKCTHWSKVETC